MTGLRIKDGVDLPDFEIMNNALKVTYIRRIHKSSSNARERHIPLSVL